MSVYRNVDIETCTENQGIQCLKSPKDTLVVSSQRQEITGNRHKQDRECLREVALKVEYLSPKRLTVSIVVGLYKPQEGAGYP